jgi:putative spermidine/putrescine transport system substrate-binding protein
VDIVASTTGWDINPRALGTVPEGVKVTPFDGMTWVTDAHYAVIPKGVSADVVSADIALIKWMLTPQQQAKAYDTGYFYPGPAVNGVTLNMAPKASQDVIAKFGRPEYEGWISRFPKETSLPAPAQVAMFDKWDREVGAGKYKTQ